MLLILSLGLLFSSIAASYNISADDFCLEKPTGLFCLNATTKIECPTKRLHTCQPIGKEICQERGILNERGYKGGIARCVPKLSPDDLKLFCDKKKHPGVYCWGNATVLESNLRIHCPTGLIYKCHVPPLYYYACRQKYPHYAVCDGSESSNSTTSCPPPLLFTKYVTVSTTVTQTIKTCPGQNPYGPAFTPHANDGSNNLAWAYTSGTGIMPTMVVA